MLKNEEMINKSNTINVSPNKNPQVSITESHSWSMYPDNLDPDNDDIIAINAMPMNTMSMDDMIINNEMNMNPRMNSRMNAGINSGMSSGMSSGMNTRMNQRRNQSQNTTIDPDPVFIPDPIFMQTPETMQRPGGFPDIPIISDRPNRPNISNIEVGQNGVPLTAPPDFTPLRQSASAFRVDAQTIRGCIGRFTYIWLDNGQEFWMFPVQLGRHSVSGFRFHRPFAWTFFGISLNRIDAFMCF